MVTKHLISIGPNSIIKKNNNNQSFFTLFRNLFARLAADECSFTDHSVDDYPSFGYSTWPWATPSAGSNSRQGSPPSAARHFYNFWLGFATAKDFAWADSWNTGEAPDRQVRRLMERDNKKARENARKEYNDTVKVSPFPYSTQVISLHHLGENGFPPSPPYLTLLNSLLLP